MARSKNGCLKILVCAGSGSDPAAGSDADADDHPDESKAISDKSRWSFRRRSTRHRVLKNSDISEPETLSSSKAKADITPSNNVYTSTYSYASEKPLQQDKPDEKILRQEKPEEKPLHQENSDEKLLEKPIEKPIDKLMEEPADQIIEKSIELRLATDTLPQTPHRAGALCTGYALLPTQKITESPTDEPAEKINDAPAEEPAEKITETASENTAEGTIENATEETPERAVEELIEEPDETISVSSTGPKQGENTSLVEGSSADPEEDHLESAATNLQPGSGTCIAREELLNQKDLVKLQAVIRGHLVRKQASESLQCLLAIIKIQGLIRAHQAQHSPGKIQESIVHSSGEKLLRNGFALKLMDNTSTSKSIHIKCDPSESDVTWEWMERWTALIPPITVEHLPEHEENSELMGGTVTEQVTEHSQCDEDIVQLDSDLSFPKLVADDVKETAEISDSSALEAPASVPDESPKMEMEHDPESELIETTNVDAEQVTDQKAENDVDEPLMSLDQQYTQADALRDPCPLPGKFESSNEDSSDAYNSEQTLEMEGKRFVARKSCNPAFAAAQLKFEELSTNSTVSRSSSSSHLDGASKSRVHTPSSQEDSSSKQDGTGILESSVGHDTKMIVAASECGTEISISSTLDSPDRSEGDGGEIVMEIGALENRNYVTGKADKDSNIVHSEVKNAPEVEAQPQKEVEQNGHVPALEIEAQPQKELVQGPHVEPEMPDLHERLEKSVASYATPEGTPMSRTTIPESHGTPSSEVSVNTKKSRSKKPKSHASKRSLASPGSESVGRSSTDNFSKESRHAKRENSSKAAKSDHIDQEPRMSNSNSNSNPLPSYMQFTESARAKASSPKMSPDVQDSNPRKRHSLPMTDGKHDSSPRMQRSSSQAQQNVKSNGPAPHNSSDKRWHI
ncbi:protein IQ-DOMAIN 32-like [Miscanthus floridulus]|uniref:protein IQ-DOMAIN 32-like n=1 Tax=Miscanthus floridulus TaxID=154761 RepID=UPI00345AB914